MSAGQARHPVLERSLARLLRRGTWLATGIIAAGVVPPLIGWPASPPATIGPRIVTTGIALFIALPVLRVLLMSIVFVRERDYRFGAIALLVLTIIALSGLLGVLHRTGGVPG